MASKVCILSLFSRMRDHIFCSIEVSISAFSLKIHWGILKVMYLNVFLKHPRLDVCFGLIYMYCTRFQKLNAKRADITQMMRIAKTLANWVKVIGNGFPSFRSWLFSIWICSCLESASFSRNQQDQLHWHAAIYI